MSNLKDAVCDLLALGEAEIQVLSPQQLHEWTLQHS